jgi:hypothetical protein
MFKHLSICAALFALAISPATAQQEAVLQRIAVPGAAFDIVVASPKAQGVKFDLARSPDALIMQLIGGELALGFDGEKEMLKALDTLQLPAFAFHTEGRNGKSRLPVAVYIVPRDE